MEANKAYSNFINLIFFLLTTLLNITLIMFEISTGYNLITIYIFTILLNLILGYSWLLILNKFRERKEVNLALKLNSIMLFIIAFFHNFSSKITNGLGYEIGKSQIAINAIDTNTFLFSVLVLLMINIQYITKNYKNKEISKIFIPIIFIILSYLISSYLANNLLIRI